MSLPFDLNPNILQDFLQQLQRYGLNPTSLKQFSCLKRATTPRAFVSEHCI